MNSNISFTIPDEHEFYYRLGALLGAKKIVNHFGENIVKENDDIGQMCTDDCNKLIDQRLSQLLDDEIKKRHIMED